jgi:hypothetical protein
MCLKLAEKHGEVAASIGAGGPATEHDRRTTFAGGRKSSNFTER